MVMLTRNINSLLLSTLACACAAESSDEADCPGGTCDDQGETCSDSRYGDGTCQTDLTCAAPDIDCFVTFDSDANAQQWFSGLEQQIAEEQQRPPRAFVPETDPRFAKVRAL